MQINHTHAKKNQKTDNSLAGCTLDYPQSLISAEMHVLINSTFGSNILNTSIVRWERSNSQKENIFHIFRMKNLPAENKASK